MAGCRCAAHAEHLAKVVRAAGPVDEQGDSFPNGALKGANKVGVRHVQRGQTYERLANE